MKITDDMIREWAFLARLEFEGEALDSVRADLNKILTLVDKLNELDTEGIEPLIYMTDHENVLREDEPSVSITKEQALSNAPSHDSDYFKVPKVIPRDNQ